MYSLDSKLSDILLEQPAVVTVVNRFGITLGVGDSTVQSAAFAAGINADFLLMVINTYVSEHYEPQETEWQNIAIESVADYLEKTDDYYEKFQLPNIERHFNSLVRNSDSDNDNLEMLLSFFLEMKQELLTRIQIDRDEVFPILRNWKSSEFHLSENKIDKLLALDELIEEKLSDLSSFFIIHLRGEYDMNLCVAVVSAVFALSKDIKQNNRIRRHTLVPILQKISNG